MAKKKALNWIVYLLVFFGTLNWGLIGLTALLGTQFNLLQTLLGGVPLVLNLVYLAAGLAGIYLTYKFVQK